MKNKILNEFTKTTITKLQNTTRCGADFDFKKLLNITVEVKNNTIFEYKLTTGNLFQPGFHKNIIHCAK